MSSLTNKAKKWFKDPRTRLFIAWFHLIGAAVGMILTLIFNDNEPPFILFLSWYAIIITSLDVLFTSDVRANQ